MSDDPDVLGRIAAALERQAEALDRLATVAERTPGVVRVAGAPKPPRRGRPRPVPVVEASELDRARAAKALRRAGLVKP